MKKGYTACHNFGTEACPGYPFHQDTVSGSDVQIRSRLDVDGGITILYEQVDISVFVVCDGSFKGYREGPGSGLIRNRVHGRNGR